MRKSGPIQLENGSMSANIESYCKLLSLSSIADNYEHMAIDATKTAYFTLFFHPFHSKPSTFLSLKQACKIVA